MPLDVKPRKNNFSALERAARKRARDYENESLTKREEDVRTATFLSRTNYAFKPGQAVNQPTSSNHYREFMRDSRFFVALNNIELNDLEKDTDSFLRRSLNAIQRIQKDTDALDASILEEEIRFYKDYDQVHYNGFIRERDMPLSQQSKQWMIDLRTESSFERHQLLNLIPSTGLTLPVSNKLRIPILNAHLVGEETDVGDTKKPIIEGDVRDVFLPDKVFRWVIIRREHDKTTRKYKHDTSYVTILLDLPGIQLVNWLEAIPAAASSLLIDGISYLDEANEEVSLSTLQVDSRGGLIFLFEPIRARRIKIRFAQYAPVVKLGRDHEVLEIKELNKLLDGLDWVSRFDQDSEYIEGRVFDFSIRDIQVGLNTYLPTGIFRSKDVHVANIASAIVTDAIEEVPITTSDISGVPDTLPDVEAFSEYYLGMDIQNKQGKRLLKDLIPIPDTYPIQTEFLPLVGSDGRLKLMPDLLWNLLSNRVLTATSVSLRRLDIVTNQPHGFEVGDRISFTVPAGHVLVGNYLVKAVNGTYGFSIQTTGPSVDAEVTENTTPYLKVYLSRPSIVNVESPPIRVFRDGVELFVGTDYLLNFGTADTWSTQFPTGVDLQQTLEDARSGKCHIRMVNPSFTSVYWVEYKPLANQWLGRTKLVKLKNGRVVFDSKFRKCKGTINTVSILRGDFTNPYTTPLLRNYSLKVRNWN
jgi:hypothetical protein